MSDQQFLPGQRTTIVVLVNPDNVKMHRRQPGVQDENGNFVSPQEDVQWSHEACLDVVERFEEWLYEAINGFVD